MNEKKPFVWQEINGVDPKRRWGSDVAEPSHTQASGFSVHPTYIDFSMYIYIYIFDIYICLHCCTLVTSVRFCILNMHISVLLHFNDVHIKITICLATAPCISIHGCIHMRI